MGWLKAAIRESGIRFGFITRPDFVVQFVADHPIQGSMEPGIVYVVGGRGYQKWALFLCPRHEHEIVQLSLMPNRRPRWTITADFLERPTIDPSVRQLEDSYAHFWIRRGKVQWCTDTGQRPRWMETA